MNKCLRYFLTSYQIFIFNLFIILSKLENKELPYDGFAYGETRSSEELQNDMLSSEQREVSVNCDISKITENVNGIPSSKDFCTLFRAKACLINLESIGDMDSEENVMCVELVGSRFLRKMVRIIVATAIRESLQSDRDEDILLKVAMTRNRFLASNPAPGEGLALCGVGFDLEDLAIYKHMPKKKTID